MTVLPQGPGVYHFMGLTLLPREIKFSHSVSRHRQIPFRRHHLRDGKIKEWKKRVLLSRAAWHCEEILGFGFNESCVTLGHIPDLSERFLIC